MTIPSTRSNKYELEYNYYINERNTDDSFYWDIIEAVRLKLSGSKQAASNISTFSEQIDIEKEVI